MERLQSAIQIAQMSQATEGNPRCLSILPVQLSGMRYHQERRSVFDGLGLTLTTNFLSAKSLSQKIWFTT
jgi:hypothetical protein